MDETQNICQIRADHELISAIRRGDRTAAEQLAQRYYPKVLHVCFTFFRCHDDVHDAAQEVFTKVLGERKICQFRGNSEFWTWLYRVTVNTCKTWANRRQRDKRMLVSEKIVPLDQIEHIGAEYQTMEQQFEKEWQIGVLHRVLASLPENYKKILLLVYWEGKSYQEAARSMNMAPQVLGVKLMRGKNMLVKFARPAMAESPCN